MYKSAHPLRNSYKILLHFLEVSVLHGTVVVLRGLALLTCVACVCAVETAVCTVESLTCAGLCAAGLAVHLGGGGLHHLVEVGGCGVDSCDVAGLVSVLQLLEGLLYGGLLVGRNLVAVVLEEVLGGEYHRVGLVQLVNALALLLVVLGVLLCLGFHAVNLLFAQTTRSLYADGLFLARSLVLCAYVQYAVCVDVKGNLNLRNATASGCYVLKRFLNFMHTV